MASGSRTGRARSRWGAFLQSFSGSMEMPQDVVLDVPRATLIGAIQVQVENHKGVLEYTPTRVRIGTRDGVFVITGTKLKIGSIYRDEVVIDGRISSVDLRGPQAETEKPSETRGKMGNPR